MSASRKRSQAIREEKALEKRDKARLKELDEKVLRKEPLTSAEIQEFSIINKRLKR
jgi:hypothetical protein